jgi:hypothetical protein
MTGACGLYNLEGSATELPSLYGLRSRVCSSRSWECDRPVHRFPRKVLDFPFYNTPERIEREEREKPKREGRGSRSYDVSLPLSVGPDGL